MRWCVVTAIVLACTATASAVTIPLNDYIVQLDTMRAALHERRVADAQNVARALKGSTVQMPDGSFTADGSLLEAVLANRTGTEGRLLMVANELRKSEPAKATPVDPRLLERLRKAEEPGRLKAGGEVPQPEIGNKPLLDRIFETFAKLFEWIGNELDKLWQWLRELWPEKETPTVSGGSAMKTKWTVAALVLAILAVVGILTWEVLRRSKRNVAAPAAGSEPVASARDEDPTSRGANEWERYAAQLAAAGRIREAIRAWYHAVLVTCYGAGVLHFRKGRTNWEYVAALSPELTWRGDFVAFTRRFENEWYGRATSSRDALDECAERAGRIIDGIRHNAGKGLAA